MQMVVARRFVGPWRQFVIGSLLTLAFLAAMPASALAQGAGLNDTSAAATRRDPARELAMKITSPFTFVAVGDLMILRPMAELQEPRLQSLLNVMRQADWTYANLEGPIVDPSDPDYHGPTGGGPKTILNDLHAMGVRGVGTANNHITDAGIEGMLMTNRLLDSAGITHSGTGNDLVEARKAQIGIVPKGTVAAVSMYVIDPSSNPGRTQYSDARDKSPGLNPLHVTPYNIVSAEQLETLRGIRDEAYAHRSEVTVPVAATPLGERPGELTLFGTRYRVGDTVGALSYTINPSDLSGVIKSIRAGKQVSDFLIASAHVHQNSFSYQAYSHDNSTPDFLVSLAHQAIDNGADVFVGQGVHTLRGVEIYKGKPIFYGMASFVQHEEAAIDVTDPSGPAPREQLHEPDTRAALLTSSRYDGGKLVEVRLYPVDCDIAGDRSLSRSGLPLTPSPDQAQRILQLVQTLSAPFGTKISIENNVGVIHVAG